MNAIHIGTFLDGKFVLDCPKIILTPCSNLPDKKQLVGAGTITADEDAPGRFLLKVFFEESFAFEDTFSTLKWTAGKVIDDEHYYDLEARDISGTTWISERLLPNKSVGPNGSMINAAFRNLVNVGVGHAGVQGTEARFYFSELIKVPLNTVLNEESKVGDAARSFSSGLKLARFSSQGVNFEVDNSSGKTVFLADFDEVDASLNLVNRAFEALCFALAHTKSWSVLVVLGASERKTFLRAVDPEPQKTRTGPPLQFISDHASQSVWKLFDQYYCHVSQDVEPSFHQLSLLIRSVLESGKASLDVQALTLAVTIESLLMDTMKDQYVVSEELKNNIHCAGNLISECGSLPSSFRQRVLGSLRAMNNPRAKDVLAELKKKLLIDPALVKTYGKLRNQMTHGAQDPNADIQELFNQTSSVLVLFYQLIFLIIGYQGSFSDYGEYGYPIKEYSGTLA